MHGENIPSIAWERVSVPMRRFAARRFFRAHREDPFPYVALALGVELSAPKLRDSLSGQVDAAPALSFKMDAASFSEREIQVVEIPGAQAAPRPAPATDGKNEFRLCVLWSAARRMPFRDVRRRRIAHALVGPIPCRPRSDSAMTRADLTARRPAAATLAQGRTQRVASSGLYFPGVRKPGILLSQRSPLGLIGV